MSDITLSQLDRLPVRWYRAGMNRKLASPTPSLTVKVELDPRLCIGMSKDMVRRLDAGITFKQVKGGVIIPGLKTVMRNSTEAIGRLISAAVDLDKFAAECEGTATARGARDRASLCRYMAALIERPKYRMHLWPCEMDEAFA